MAAFTAINGAVSIDGSPVPDVTKWSVNPKCENQAYASSSTAGWKKRLAGCHDLSGSFECKAQSAAPPCKPGQSVTTLLLTMTTGQTLSGPAIIDDVNADVDVDGGAIVGWTVNFSADGQWDAFD